jgi:hypothetical protein
VLIPTQAKRRLEWATCHWMPHKPNSNPQVRKFVVAVQGHLGGQIVMQFDMPDAALVSASCGAQYLK